MSTKTGLGYTGEDALEEYIVDHLEPESPLLHELYRDTHIRLLNPRMASGHLQGRLLKMLIGMIRPRTLLEVGTFTGYATLCMAEGMPEDGIVHTIEIDDELEDFILEHLRKSPYAGRIKLHIGDALKIVPTLGLKFDAVFLDADKRQYPAYYEQLFDYVSDGGYILADNTLWDGHVIDPAYDRDQQTLGVRRFNDMVKADPRVEEAIIPVRDGITIIRKKKVL